MNIKIKDNMVLIQGALVASEEFSLSELLAELQSTSRVYVASLSSYSELRASDQTDVLVANSA